MITLQRTKPDKLKQLSAVAVDESQYKMPRELYSVSRVWIGRWRYFYIARQYDAFYSRAKKAYTYRPVRFIGDPCWDYAACVAHAKVCSGLVFVPNVMRGTIRV